MRTREGNSVDHCALHDLWIRGIHLSGQITDVRLQRSCRTNGCCTHRDRIRVPSEDKRATPRRAQRRNLLHERIVELHPALPGADRDFLEVKVDEDNTDAVGELVRDQPLDGRARRAGDVDPAVVGVVCPARNGLGGHRDDAVVHEVGDWGIDGKIELAIRQPGLDVRQLVVDRDTDSLLRHGVEWRRVRKGLTGAKRSVKHVCTWRGGGTHRIYGGEMQLDGVPPMSIPYNIRSS